MQSEKNENLNQWEMYGFVLYEAILLKTHNFQKQFMQDIQTLRTLLIPFMYQLALQIACFERTSTVKMVSPSTP